MLTRASLLVLVLGLLLTGCAATPPDNSVAPVAADRYDPAYRAAIDVLQRHGFTVDRQDHRFGQITSDPLTAPAVFEPWRRTNTTASQALVSTMNDQRRTVTVSFEQSADAQADAATQASTAPYQLRVEVLIERMQAPTRRVLGPTRGRTLYELRRVPYELDQRGIPESYWTPIGRDPYLEQRLLTQILERVES